jgi:uncharacterized protein (DUF433 family)
MKCFAGVRHLIRKPRATHEVLRDYPTYSIPEAAVILAMSRRTLQRWVSDAPFFSVAGDDQPQKLLSFKDLTQIYYLQFLRRHARLSEVQTRQVLDSARQITGSAYPLLHESIRAWPRHVVWSSKTDDRVIELFKPRGQYVFREVANMFASRVDRDKRGLTLRIYPWRLWKEGDTRRPVEVDPMILSGRLVITGTRIPVMSVAVRTKSGEPLPDIAKDYGISQQRITQSLRHLEIGLRKAA